ncbi:MAG: VWA domain-containing protein [Myxococcales bacterium]|nr:VWA domain-containing protein [Myxococcales bacterium]MDD9971280.1 VWA domain-containing protein [Myxococcales bacterium]
MTWHTTDALWLLLLVPLLAGAALVGFRMRVRSRRRFGEAAGLGMIRGRSGALRAAKAIVLLSGLALAVLALARPQYGSRTKVLRKRGVDVVVALDFSKSMLAQDVKPNRIDRAKAELTAFINELGGDRIGIVAFAGDTMEFPMTVDYSAAALFFRELGPHDMPVGGTAIGRALVASKRLLDRANRGQASPTGGEAAPPSRAKVVVLLTDGEDHEGDPLKAAEELAEIGARVYVVGIGSRTGEMIPTYTDDGTWTGYLRDDGGKPILTAMTKENEAQLTEIAELTGGKYLAAGRGRVGIDQIRSEMQHMKQSELKARRITVHEERYALVLLAAFLLLVLEGLLPDAWLPNRAQSEAR